MKHFTLLFSLLVSKLLLSQSISPNVIATCGETIQNGNNMLTWTLGETTIINIQSAGNYLSQGFQQPNYILNPGVNNLNSQFDVSIFPNPTSNILTVDICTKEKMSLEIIVTDITGKVILTENLPTSLQHNIKIDFQKFPSAVYILNIIDAKDNTSESYKIQKTN